jgi:SAM-dependent methyltransferase
MGDQIAITQHDIEIQANLDRWNAKPLLRNIYREFHQQIANHVLPSDRGLTVELGSGIGNIKEVIPHCIRTDLFPNPWIDRTENAYKLSFEDCTVANVILFDVFHHLRYPGTALKELARVLVPGGRVIIFDPCMSLLGLGVYGIGHHEPISVFDAITWGAPAGWKVEDDSYYAAQGNAYRVFFAPPHQYPLDNMRILVKKRFSAISYVASGGYGKAQLYPDALYSFMKVVDNLADFLPILFATRLLVVLEKTI